LGSKALSCYFNILKAIGSVNRILASEGYPEGLIASINGRVVTQSNQKEHKTKTVQHSVIAAEKPSESVAVRVAVLEKNKRSLKVQY